MNNTLRRVRRLGRAPDGRHVFEDLDYPADAPRLLGFNAAAIAAAPDRYCQGGQFFALSQAACAVHGYPVPDPKQ